jgi:colicin import membrane protein
MDTSPSVRDRINTAADALYEESGRRTMPTVDAVRKLAKVNINDASTCMREWRRARSAPAEVPQPHLPEQLHLSCVTALRALWMEAVNLSGETLRMAQAGWDAERADAEALNEQIGSACAALEDELLTTKTQLESQKEINAQLHEQLGVSQGRAAEAEHSVVELRTAVSHLEARSLEIGRRADDLRQALEQAHATYIASSGEQATSLRVQREEIVALRNGLELARQKSETSAVAMQEKLRMAVEEAARLRGSLDAISNGNGSVPGQPKLSARHSKLKQ